MSEFLQSLISLRSPEWREMAAEWYRSERRFRGGPDVKNELVRLYSEKTEHGFNAGFGSRGWDSNRTRGWHNGRLFDDRNVDEERMTDLAAQGIDTRAGEENLITGGYSARQDLSIWPALQRLTAEKFVGRLFQDVPGKENDRIDFGSLGDPSNPDSRAYQLWDRADGTDDSASSMWSFFEEQNQWAMVTGYRWIMVRSDQVGATLEDEREGARPYFQGISPLDVVYHKYNTRGQLDVVILKTFDNDLRLEDGVPTNAPRKIYTVMTREGFRGLGDVDITEELEFPEELEFDFSQGGFVSLAEDGSLLTNSNGEPLMGTWDHPGGEIPMVKFFYDRFGSSVMSQLGNASSTIMNLDSWALYDIFQSAKRLRFFGIAGDATIEEQAKSLEVVFKHLRAGDPYIGVPIAGNSRLTVYDSGEVTANAAILSHKDSVLAMVTDLLMKEITTGPRQSGSSQSIRFQEGNAPRLAAMSENLEDAWNQSMRLMEHIWVGTTEPTARLTMPRRFKLEGSIETLTDAITSMAQARVNSPELMTRYVLAKLKESGELSEDQIQTIEPKIREEVSIQFERQKVGLAADRAQVEALRGPGSPTSEEIENIEDEIDSGE